MFIYVLYIIQDACYYRNNNILDLVICDAPSIEVLDRTSDLYFTRFAEQLHEKE